MIFIRKSHSDTQKIRDQRRDLLFRMESLRLPKMLQALGIGFSKYFYSVSIDDIEKCVIQCESCETIDQCDVKLKIPELNPEDVAFCPSKDHLSEFSRAKRIRG